MKIRTGLERRQWMLFKNVPIGSVFTIPYDENSYYLKMEETDYGVNGVEIQDGHLVCMSQDAMVSLEMGAVMIIEKG